MVRSASNSWQKTRDSDAAYGEISVESNATATTIGSSSSDFSNKVQVTIFDTDGLSQHMTPDNSTDDITVVISGRYLITARFNFTGTASDDISAAIFANNGARQLSARGTKAVDSTDADAELTIACVADLIADETIELWVQNETAGNNITVVDAVLIASRIG